MRHFPGDDHATVASNPVPFATRSWMGYRNLLTLVVVYSALMSVIALYLSHDTFVWLYSEAGPFELLSLGFWLLLAALCFSLPGLPRRPWQQGIVAMVAAAREADLHKAFTEGSVLKFTYYFDSSTPLLERLLVALVTFPLVALVLYVLVGGARFIHRSNALRFEWGQTVLLAMILLVASKMLDRSGAVLADWFGLGFPLLLQRFVAAFEEGTEMLLPILFMAALLQYQYQHLTGVTGAAGASGRGPGVR